MKNIKKLLIVLLSGALFIASCKKEDDVAESSLMSTTPDATIRGIVKTPNGTLVKCAQIIVGNYRTKSDANGRFSLDVPHGNLRLTIQTGKGKVFKTSFLLSIQKGDTIVLDAQQQILQQTGTMAFIPGDYDAIELIIASLGYSADTLTVSDLSASALINTYDALFLNCGALDPDHMDSLRYLNLMDFVHNHGSIYASDWAVDFLTGDGFMRQANSAPSHSHSKHLIGEVKGAAACLSPVLGGFIADSALCTSKFGASILVTGASVVDPDLISVLGQNTIDIDYNLSGWAMINQYDDPFNPLIIDSGFGTLAVKSNYMGENGGRIFYTTFHNHPQTGISNQVRDILDYFILNL